jgi:microcystin-dependent protein
MSDPFLGEIKLVSFPFAPKGWAMCNGQSLPVNQNQALFSLLGTTYGGDGVTTFKLPDLRGRVPLHAGQGIPIGGVGGEERHTLTIAEMPQHFHVLMANNTTAATANANTPAAGNALGQSIGVPSTGGTTAVNIYNSTLTNNAVAAPQMIGNAGGGQQHENRQPFMVLNACIALQGVYPTRS